MKCTSNWSGKTGYFSDRHSYVLREIISHRVEQLSHGCQHNIQENQNSKVHSKCYDSARVSIFKRIENRNFYAAFLKLHRDNVHCEKPYTKKNN